MLFTPTAEGAARDSTPKRELIALCFCLAGRDESQLPIAGPSVCRGAKPFGRARLRPMPGIPRCLLYDVAPLPTSSFEWSNNWVVRNLAGGIM
jgi:hypothetical protein